MAHKYTASDYLFQFVTIMAGVLIAMLANGMVERSKDRELVATARATILREIQDNLKELEGLPQSVAASTKDVENGLTLANELLKTGKSSVRSVQLNFDLATLHQSSWQSAERTGALAHMPYEEVKEYSELYDMQELFAAQQRKAVDLVASGSALIASSFDPTAAEKEDLWRFREQLMFLQSNLLITEQLGKQLVDGYREFLQK